LAQVQAGRDRVLLLVDIDNAVRRSTRRLLEQNGWRVLDCSSGAERWFRLVEPSVDIAAVIADVRMTGLAGIVLTQRIWVRNPSQPIELCSGYDVSGDESCSAVYGAIFLKKPFSMSNLDNAVAAALAFAAFA